MKAMVITMTEDENEKNIGFTPTKSDVRQLETNRTSVERQTSGRMKCSLDGTYNVQTHL
jgi:hypothetical protein